MHLVICVIPKLTNPFFFNPMHSRLCLKHPFLGIFLFKVFWSAFDSDYCFRSLMASVEFNSLYPFVNPARFSPDGLTISDYKNVMWPDSKENAVCMMLGAVHSCNIIHPTAAGNNKIRALTIIPSTPAYQDFQHFLWKKYSTSVLYGPFDYGCLLTFTSRREGLTSSCKLFLFSLLHIIYLIRSLADGSSQPQATSKGRKRNMKAFGSSAAAPPAALWYEKNFPPFIDYDQDSMYL
jgi:hypothetical protein